MTLTERVTAKLDEWEAVARAATPGPWWAAGVWYHHFPVVGGGPDEVEAEPWPAVGHGTTGADVIAHTARADHADAAHIALHDPAAVLGLVAGLRAALAEHEPHEHGGQLTERWCPSCTAFDPCPTLLAVAGALGLDAGGAE